MQNKRFFQALAKYSGLVALGIYVVTCVAIVVANYESASYTISRHIGLSPTTAIIFAIACTIATALLAFNLFYYSRKRWDFGRVFVAYAVITAACLALIGWFPYVDDGLVIVSLIHRAAAWFLIFMTPLFVMVFLRKARRKTDSKLFHAVLILFLVQAVVCAGIAVLVPNLFFSTSLFSESLYLISLVVVTQVLAFAPNNVSSSK
jgi:hypothetical protein